jgi:hypothetical protein
MQSSTYYDLDEGFDTDPADRWDADAFEPRDIANYDYTATIPPVPGTYDPREDEEQEYGCECEIDWKCGVCRENGYRHSRLDAFGLGPDADLSGPSDFDVLMGNPMQALGRL